VRSKGRPAAIVIAGATRFQTRALESQVAAVQTQITTLRPTEAPQEKPESFMTQRPVFQELYDWFYRRYGRAAKETLLELMGDDVDIERLRELSQRELAEFYCQRSVYSAVGPDRTL